MHTLNFGDLLLRFRRLEVDPETVLDPSTEVVVDVQVDDDLKFLSVFNVIIQEDITNGTRVLHLFTVERNSIEKEKQAPNLHLLVNDQEPA
jgi:hypothetical protein